MSDIEWRAKIEEGLLRLAALIKRQEGMIRTQQELLSKAIAAIEGHQRILEAARFKVANPEPPASGGAAVN